jgi:hypothetical protein
MKTVVAVPAALVLAALVIIAGCGKPPSSDSSARAVTPTPAPRPANRSAHTASPRISKPTPSPSAPAAPAADTLAGFAPDKVIFVTFKEINADGYPIVTLTNLTGRDIDDISGAFRLHDADGSILHSTGLTIAVPGDLFLAADTTTESSPFGLNRRQELMERLATTPDELSFSFEAREVTFMESHASAE